MIAVTGATGQLGRLVIDELLSRMPATEILAAVRNPEAAADLAAKGVTVRLADYDQPETLTAAFRGADKLLLISSNAVGQRTAQHQAVIQAAKAAGVQLLAYTSILNCSHSPLMLAEEHQATEALLAQADIPHVLLRNGWYTENYTMNIAAARQMQTLFGCAGAGRFATAPRADYAAAAATVLCSDTAQAGKTYELAGDSSFSLSEYAAELSTQCGETISYENLPQEAFGQALQDAGLPEGFATALADAEHCAASGWLDNDSKALKQLLGRSSVSLQTSIAAALAE